MIVSDSTLTGLLFQDRESNLHMASNVTGSEMVVDVLIKTGANVDVAMRVSGS